MVLIANNGDIKRGMVTKRWLFITSIVGVLLMIIPVALIYFDPVSYAVQHKLRLENGSMLNDLLLTRFTSTKVLLYLFNITNADRFLSGADEKLHLEEIGPFVYQEYRTNIDLEINKDPGIMRYTPRIEPVFLLEESVGDPKDIIVTVPNIAMLAATALVSKYSFLVRQVYNLVAASSKSKAIVTVTAYDYIWGYQDPLIQLANNVVPGLIYFKSVGLFERFYDVNVDFRLELGTTNADKFSVKKATKIPIKDNRTDIPKTSIEKYDTFVFDHTYEGAAFPPGLTPDRPIFIYRHGLCKTLQLQYQRRKKMAYGGEAFVYHFHNDTFKDHLQCDTKGWCPEGLRSYADCYFGFPIALSKGHFLDSDPRLLDMVEGLKPNRTIHDTHMIIDPKIGVGITGSMSLQLNLALADVGYNTQTRLLKDTVLPISNIIVKAPPMIKEVDNVLQLMYTQGPYITLTTQVLCLVLGVLLLLHTAKMMYWNRLAQRKEECSKQTKWPLLIS